MSDMKFIKFFLIVLMYLGLLPGCSQKQIPSRIDFDLNWKFYLGDDSLAYTPSYDDSGWRELDLPHDWSIEGEFSVSHPATPEGGALPTGIGWYRKDFRLAPGDKNKQIYIDFDGVFCNSKVWINGVYLGNRPYGYSSFRYDLTPFLNFDDDANNCIAVRVDNSAQPASRWYTGSGIYRHVWLVRKNSIHVDHWGLFVTTSIVDSLNANVDLKIKICKIHDGPANITVRSDLMDGSRVLTSSLDTLQLISPVTELGQTFNVTNPLLWYVDSPHLYTIRTRILENNQIIDEYETPFGIRSFRFDSEKGFFINGKHLKIHGVNQHHDLGALGAAVNTRAMERQLEILKDMGCNAIRMAHNPPAPELLDLCDQLGFLVIDEAFDEWKRTKAQKGYHLYWDEWHLKDLQDMVLRDRNHPSIIAWSIGNEIPEQFDSTGIAIARELVKAAKELDPSRPVTAALTETDPKKNFIYQSGALDLLCFNYKHKEYLQFPSRYPGECLLPSENMSAISSRGHYDFPSDSIRVWPPAYNVPFEGNEDFIASAFDNVHAYWGATHEETWGLVKNNDFISGMFIWSGFDYLGEPIPYPFPAKSSYLGIIDLCGFPKDVYYMYQSEWTDKTVLHLFPHWNWKIGQTVDLWVYYNQADEVELFVNNVSQGRKSKPEGTFHVMWRVPFRPGSIKAVSYRAGKKVAEKEIHTAGPARKIELEADRTVINADGKDLVFITVKITDEQGNLVPTADNLVHFDVTGAGEIAGVDNGYQASLESFKTNHRKAFNGMCLLIVKSTNKAGKIKINAYSKGLTNQEIIVEVDKINEIRR